jgi:hypothetical protein
MMKLLFLLLIFTYSLNTNGQKKTGIPKEQDGERSGKPCLSDPEAEKLRVYWCHHWREKVKAFAVPNSGKRVTIKVVNSLPYDISNCSLTFTQIGPEKNQIVAGKIEKLGSIKSNFASTMTIHKYGGTVKVEVNLLWIEVPAIGLTKGPCYCN